MSKRIRIAIWMMVSMMPMIHGQVLYQISSGKAQGKSYLLATDKLTDMTFLDTIPNLFKAYGRTKRVVTEFTMQDYEAIAALRKAALLPDTVRLQNFYTEIEYTQINDALMLALGMGLDKLARMKPSYLTEMYRDDLLKKWANYDDSRSMEHFFETLAIQQGRSVIGLDKTGEALYMMFDREPFHHQCKELLSIIEHPEREVRLAKGISELYRNGRLLDIMYLVSGPDNQSTLSYSDYQVYAQRNQQWVKRLTTILQEGPCFICLNAIYLGGEKGLIHQLQAAGYKVVPANTNKGKLRK